MNNLFTISMGSQHSLVLSSQALWGQILVLCVQLLVPGLRIGVRKARGAGDGDGALLRAQSSSSAMQVLLSCRHGRKSCAAAEWICLGRAPSRGNCVTILGQRFPLGDIRQYFKYPRVLSPALPSSSSSSRQIRPRRINDLQAGDAPG